MKTQPGSKRAVTADAETPVLDLRLLPPPEPLQRALEALERLTPGEKIAIRTRFRPAHLIDQLEARGGGHSIVSLGAAGWETTLWREPQQPTP